MRERAGEHIRTRLNASTGDVSNKELEQNFAKIVVV